MEKKQLSDQFLEEDEGAGWIVTFADLMSLLLVFFVLLYSISSLNLEKFKLALDSIQVSLGQNNPAVGLIEVIDIPDLKDTKLTIEEVTGMKSREKSVLKDINKFMAKRNMNDNMMMQVLDNKIIIQVRGKLLFQSGDAVLNKTAEPILYEIVKIAESYPEYTINIKGHTDNIPISTRQFPSNWELSAVRATTVLKYFIRQGIDPRRLTATGYGDSMPILPNNTKKNRAVNRRVEFVLEKEPR